MRSSSSLFFFRRGGDGLGVSRLVPSKDAGEAVPLIALVCSGTFLFVVVVVRVLAVSLSLYLFFFFFDVMNAFFDTTRREECLLPKCSRKGQGEGESSFREMRLSVSLSLSVFPFLRCLCVVPERKSKIRSSSVGFNQESSLGRPLCRGKSFIRLDFTPRERKGNAASTSQSKRSE